MSVSWREAMDALEWVRLAMMNRGSPDFLRQLQAEGRVQALCARLLRAEAPPDRLLSRARGPYAQRASRR